MEVGAGYGELRLGQHHSLNEQQVVKWLVTVAAQQVLRLLTAFLHYLLPALLRHVLVQSHAVGYALRVAFGSDDQLDV